VVGEGRGRVLVGERVEAAQEQRSSSRQPSWSGQLEEEEEEEELGRAVTAEEEEEETPPPPPPPPPQAQLLAQMAGPCTCQSTRA
jgi:hypothetical protein